MLRQRDFACAHNWRRRDVCGVIESDAGYREEQHADERDGGADPMPLYELAQHKWLPARAFARRYRRVRRWLRGAKCHRLVAMDPGKASGPLSRAPASGLLQLRTLRSKHADLLSAVVSKLHRLSAHFARQAAPAVRGDAK